jgi:hypothetical protein
MFKQPIPNPGEPVLIYVDEQGTKHYDMIQYTWKDMVGLDAEKGCQICMQNVTIQNYNPIMYCCECESGVHARCFGEGIGDDIDLPFYCSYCELKWKKKRKQEAAIKKQNKMRKHFPSKERWDRSQIKKTLDSQIKKLTAQIEKDLEKLKDVKCYFCGLKRGFMKYDNPKTMAKAIWWHPFCALTSTCFVL